MSTQPDGNANGNADSDSTEGVLAIGGLIVAAIMAFTFSGIWRWLAEMQGGVNGGRYNVLLNIIGTLVVCELPLVLYCFISSKTSEKS